MTGQKECQTHTQGLKRDGLEFVVFGAEKFRGASSLQSPSLALGSMRSSRSAGRSPPGGVRRTLPTR